MPARMNMRELYNLVGDGKIFSAKFIKKDGSERTMVARVGVRKYLKGDGSYSYNPFEKGLLPVFDMDKKEYRFVNANTLISIRIGGQEIVFD